MTPRGARGQHDPHHRPSDGVGQAGELTAQPAGLARDLSGEGIGPAIRSGRLAAEAVTVFVRRGEPLDGYAQQIVKLYGRGERGWLGRRVAGLPDRVAEAVVRLVLGSRAARRRLVFEKIFGMKEPAA